MYKRELGDRGRPQFKSDTCESNTATAEKQKYQSTHHSTNISKPELLGRRPLVSFERSAKGEGRRRASLEKEEDNRGRVSMPVSTRSKQRKKTLNSKKVRLVNGKIRLRVGGYTGLQSLSPAHLVRHIAVSKLRIAAKKVLRLTNKPEPKRRRKSRKGKKKSKKGKRKTKKKEKKSGRRKVQKTTRKTNRRNKKKRRVVL